MGIVYEAAGFDGDGAVAIKVLQQHLVDDEAVIARFRREAHAIAGLQHPHLVEVKDFQCNPDEPPFMVMELLHGQTLRLLLKQQGPLPLGRAVAIAIQTLSALETAHRAGVIHRDIKPDNLFIVSGESGDTVKVLDFGVARLIHEDDASAVGAEAGAWVGTPSFMAPEQVRCQPVDARADLYSLGACLYQMVTGRQPIDVADTVALFSAIVEKVPPLASTLRPELPEEFSRVLARALHKIPSERFADAGEMASALRPWAPQPHAETDSDDEVTQLYTEPVPQLDAEPATQLDASLPPDLAPLDDSAPPKPGPPASPAPRRRRSALKESLLLVGATLLGVAVGAALGM